MKIKCFNEQGRFRFVRIVSWTFRGLVACSFVAISIGAVSARQPTQMDIEFCNHYAEVMQMALDVERSGDPVAINQFRQAVSRDPQADLLVRGLGVGLTTSPWVEDVTVQSRQYCLAEVRQDRRGHLPGDPERFNSMDPNNYVERIPLKNDSVVPVPTNSAPVQANVDKGLGVVSDVTLLEQWWVFQDACRGRPDDELTCGKRDNLTAALTARGYMQHNRDVWTSKSDMEHFDGIVHSTNEWAVGKSAHMRALGGVTTLQSLRRYLSDDKIIALWNDSQDFIRDAYPLAWEMLEVQMRQIVIDHSGGGDPRYLLD